jgi:hypothetical protein
MIKRIANTIEMSFDIPDSEKKEAQSASDEFKKVISVLDIAKKHLSIIYDPFKDATNISEESIHEFRGAIFKYKEQIKENFNKVKACSFLAIVKLNYFATDTHIMELVNSFKDSITDLEKEINILLDILSDLKSKDFKDNMIKSIDSIKNISSEIEKLIKERIIDYINTNILTKNWMTNTSNELNTEITARVPYITQLFQERQNALEENKR